MAGKEKGPAPSKEEAGPGIQFVKLGDHREDDRLIAGLVQGVCVDGPTGPGLVQLRQTGPHATQEWRRPALLGRAPAACAARRRGSAGPGRSSVLPRCGRRSGGSWWSPWEIPAGTRIILAGVGNARRRGVEPRSALTGAAGWGWRAARHACVRSPHVLLGVGRGVARACHPGREPAAFLGQPVQGGAITAQQVLP